MSAPIVVALHRFASQADTTVGQTIRLRDPNPYAGEVAVVVERRAARGCVRLTCRLASEVETERHEAVEAAWFAAEEERIARGCHERALRRGES